ncbi:DUF6458 family protein [Ammonicoccus fulvus]|uniref:DUF6458 family protein n=1 Tax=Ammonicoccus fulvus TaxID=3138240 RepID=A0ABZ3FWM1_9ACTN
MSDSQGIVMRAVRLGGPLTLVVIGLILALAVTSNLQGLNLNVVGWIVAGAGVVWFVLDYTLNRPVATEIVEEARGKDVDGRDITQRVVRKEEKREEF